MYEFSVPMPFTREFIDRLIFINNNVEKSRIENVYFSLPLNSPDFTGFEQGRYTTDDITTFENWKPLIEYSLNKGFNFIYLLNSPKIYNPEFENIDEKLKKLDVLINELKKIGCNKVRVCNPQVMEYLYINYPEIEQYVSTSMELQNIKQYINLFSMFGNIKEFVPSYELNKNFLFLKSIKTKFPNIKIELMVNEGCLAGCPIKTPHNIFSADSLKEKMPNFVFSNNFYQTKCTKKAFDDYINFLCTLNIIYPWEIQEYEKIGITNFKLIGRNGYNFENGNILTDYYWYLKGIDDYKNIENRPIRHFIHEYSRDTTVKEVKDYLPKIEYFKEYGHLCASRCSVECNYCYQCAEKIKEKLNLY